MSDKIKTKVEGSSSLFDKAVSPFKAIFGASVEALRSKEEGWLGKIGIFLESIGVKMGLIEKKEDEASKKADEEIASTDKDKLKSIDGITQRDANIEKADDKNLDLIFSAVHVHFEQLKKKDPSTGQAAKEAFTKIDDSSRGKETEPMSLTQLRAISAISLGAIVSLKNELGSQNAFEGALKSLGKVSRHEGNENLYKLMAIFNRDMIIKLFKPDLGLFSAGLEGLSLKGKLDKFQLSSEDFEALKSLDPAESGNRDKEKIQAALGKIMPSTRGNSDFVDSLLSIINSPSPNVEPKSLSKLLFSVSNNDLLALRNICI